MLPDNIIPERLLKDEEALQVVQSNLFGWVDTCIRTVMNEEEGAEITRLIVGRNLVAVLIPEYLDDLAEWNKHPVRRVGIYPNGTELFVSRKDDFVNLFYTAEDGKSSREFTVPPEVLDPDEDDVVVESLLEEDE